MISTVLEVAGFVCGVVAAAIILGAGAAWAAAMVSLLLCGFAAEGSNVQVWKTVQLLRAARRARKAAAAAAGTPAT